jgi:hypothetical protein
LAAEVLLELIGGQRPVLLPFGIGVIPDGHVVSPDRLQKNWRMRLSDQAQ